jgi:predicted exporter
LIRPGTGWRLLVPLAWGAWVAGCILVILQSRFTADLSAFLPSNPSVEQALLVQQLREGPASRLILMGIEGADQHTRSRLSKGLAARLRADDRFGSVQNGEDASRDADRRFLEAHRYLLSPDVTPERFTAEGLRGAIEETLSLLASPLGPLIKPLVPRDPTGELVGLVAGLEPGSGPATRDGVWASPDGGRALLLAQTRALGSDTDAQETALAAIRQAFVDALGDHLDSSGASTPVGLILTGPGVFAVSIRDQIHREVVRLSALGAGLIAGLLLLAYRSAAALMLGLLPVLTGALTGVAAVGLGFGVVHGITLGFGATLIGEAVDYAVFLFVQSRQGGGTLEDWVRRFWPTIRLGVLTSLLGFGVLLASDLPGLAQLGLYSITGLTAAALVTRYALPRLLPTNLRLRELTGLGERLGRLLRLARRLRWALAVLSLGACAVLLLHDDTLWSHELAALSPLPESDQALDGRLRAELGAPDARFLVVITGRDRDQVLEAAERAAGPLDALVSEGVLQGYESPARLLPSRATQLQRRASLPERAELERRLDLALQDLPLRPGVLAPFLDAVQAAHTAPLIEPEHLAGTSLALVVESLLLPVHRDCDGPAAGGRPDPACGDAWAALLPLRAPAAGPSALQIDAGRVSAALAASDLPQARFLDLKDQADRLYAGYLREALGLSLTGLLVIAMLLWVALGSALATLRVLLPLVLAILVAAAALVLTGERLTLMHLVGMLLTVAVGSNYGLFFQRRPGASPIEPRTLASLLVANLTTLTGFGVLATSQLPILKAIGATVAPGVVLALVFSAVLAAPQAEDQGRHRPLNRRARP